MFGKTGFLKRSSKKGKELYLKLFIVAFAAMMICFIPSMIFNKGIFLYYGDFNSQQMMFYQHANEVVRDGAIGWDWGTDLGANFIGSYSFYLLGSPFFWLTTLFPLGAVAYLMPWMLALKTAVAAVCAYAYIRRFVENKSAAFIGSMLYAFSGFQTYNVFFNHFHDATAFFPLMLLGMEMVIQDGKKGPFALAVALGAMISYFFFVGEVIFLIIYFIIRCTDKGFNITLRKFLCLTFEAVIGFVISFFILLPSVMDVLENPRITQYLYGLDLAIYSENVRIPRIIQAFFMLPDMPARVNILTSDKARWASMAGYLPMFSMCGVIAFMRTRKKSWQGKLIITSIVMACIPFFNASFILFGNSYYARWYYMPILIMCLMTAQVIDEDKDQLRKGFIPCAAVAAVFALIGLLPKKENDQLVWGKVPKYPELYYIQVIVTAIMTVMLFIAIYKVATDKKKQHVTLCVMTCAACAVCMTSEVIYGVVQGDDNEDYIERAIYGREKVDLSEYDGDTSELQNTFYRIDTSESVDNWCMYWGLSSMRAFHSVVPTSIMDFYSAIGQTRDVASRMEPRLYGLRGLFSVKYYFKEYTTKQLEGKEDPEIPEYISGLADFEYVGTQNKFYIFENKNFVPMGFGYNTYITADELENISENDKPTLLMHSLVLSNEQAKKYEGLVEHFTMGTEVVSKSMYNRACEDKRDHSCYSFTYDSDGFEAKIDLDEGRLLFFSVPYENGWSAEVNGKPVDIEKVSFGFMAVPVPAGESTVTFHFKATGLTAGRVASCVGAALLIGYIAADVVLRKKKEKEAAADAS
ncbi:MAG: YfhO family protein [Ruminococcus sp.]|nr:YfhO family protein [Ruminococcus sp.]